MAKEWPDDLRDKFLLYKEAGLTTAESLKEVQPLSDKRIPLRTAQLWWKSYQKRKRRELEVKSIREAVVSGTQRPTLTENLQTRGIDMAMIGDMQVKPGIPLDYCSWVGRYIAESRPHVIVCIGDFADMPSCSFHEKEGSKSYAEQNYKNDILSVHRGMKALMEPIQEEMTKGWDPRLVMCLGNHEIRINRAIEACPKLDGTIGLPDLEYERWGWEIYPFLEPVEIEGITFSHYFPSGPKGYPISTARSMLTKLHTSAVAGHQQGRDIAFGKRANGKQITALICGSTYVHDESYLNPQTNNHWRGMYMLNDCINGEFEEKAVSMKYLKRRYGQ